jgi:hypothetical protein
VLEKFGFICYSKQTVQIRFDSPMTLVPTTLFFPRYCFPCYCINYEPTQLLKTQLLKTQFCNYLQLPFQYKIIDIHIGITMHLPTKHCHSTNVQLYSIVSINLSPLPFRGKAKKDYPGQSSKCILYIYI